MSDHGMLPPVCSKHNEPKHIEFGRGYECRSCVREEEIAMARAKLNPLPPSEKAELQVSLLNEIGLTLTAAARALAEQAETLKTYKLSLEGIQGLLVDVQHFLETETRAGGEQFDGLASRLAQIEEAIQCKCEIIAKFRGGYATDPSKCSIHGYPTLPERPVTVKRKPSLRPVSRKKRKR